jgi:hypothetical protein
MTETSFYINLLSTPFLPAVKTVDFEEFGRSDRPDYKAACVARAHSHPERILQPRVWDLRSIINRDVMG